MGTVRSADVVQRTCGAVLDQCSAGILDKILIGRQLNRVRVRQSMVVIGILAEEIIVVERFVK